MDYVIQTENLVKKYSNGITALDGVSLKIKKGDVVGYLGPNGAGKTTTIKILTNLINPTSGHAYINGIDVNKRPKEALQHIGALIEVPGIYDYLTPHEMLTYFGKVHKMSNKEIDQRIKEVLELVKLSDWGHKKIGSFSTGMQRRLAIAKAILHNPEILILDEPVLGLDPKGIKDIRELIKRFHSEGLTVFLSSHLLQEVGETCDNVIFLDRGKVVGYDSVKNIRNKTEFKIIDVDFLNPLSREEIDKIESIELVNSIEIADEIVRIHFDGKRGTSSQILSRLISSGFEIVSYTPERMGLEDFYVSIMGDERGLR
ncbi:MAG: ABC transporter ATP-binding protein [Candidatus Thermoplasmatota archaeon]